MRQEDTLGCRAVVGATAGRWAAWSALTHLTSTGPPCPPFTRLAVGWGLQCWKAWYTWWEVRQFWPSGERGCKGLWADRLYSFPGEKDSMIFDCTERYDPVTKQWASVASLNFPRCGVGLCPCHGALYALGNSHRSHRPRRLKLKSKASFN